MIVLIDNYDSFVYNLARYFERLGQTTHVVRNDAIDVDSLAAWRPAAVVLSPGPCRPEQAGSSLEIVRRLYDQMPILGVCLGHQAIAAALGGRVVRTQQVMHGRSSAVYHEGRGILAGLPSPFVAARYHSLVVEPAALPPELEMTAWTEDGVVMAIEHRELPVVGVQFHPESILTELGYEILAAFLRRAGIEPQPSDGYWQQEHQAPPARPYALPATPVTF